MLHCDLRGDRGAGSNEAVRIRAGPGESGRVFNGDRAACERIVPCRRQLPDNSTHECRGAIVKEKLRR